jgi:MOB kinase activator 1
LERQKTLGSKDLAEQVKLPPGANVEEWLAITTIDFFNELNLLIGALQDLCTEERCPTMCAGPFVWLWADGDKIKEPQKLSAPKYFEALLTWVDAQLADETFLPVQPGVPFPATFRKGMRVIYKRLFRIYAHVFHTHFKEMMEEEADAHLNHSFKHFVYFVKEFDLMEPEELEPMKDLVALCMEQKSRGSA